MRRIGLLLAPLGLVVTLAGLFLAAGSFFTWNGRHPVAVHEVVLGTPLEAKFPARASRRYTLAVQVVFERPTEALDGLVPVEARLPLVASIEDATGTTSTTATGWIDPSQPPTVLYGQKPAAAQRRPRGADPAELAAERLVGPIDARTDQDFALRVELGLDRVGRVPIRTARAVVYDDALPPALRRSLLVAAIGAVGFAIGVVGLLLSSRRKRRGGSGRRQNV